MSGSSQNIETISTQFRILSTVKATMLSKFFICIYMVHYLVSTYRYGLQAMIYSLWTEMTVRLYGYT